MTTRCAFGVLRFTFSLRVSRLRFAGNEATKSCEDKSSSRPLLIFVDWCTGTVLPKTAELPLSSIPPIVRSSRVSCPKIDKKTLPHIHSCYATIPGVLDATF